MRKPNVALCTMEAGLPNLSGEYQQANYRGGLGLLIHDFIGGLASAFHDDINIRVFAPLYPRLWFHRNTRLNYKEVLGDPDETLRVSLHKESSEWDVAVWTRSIYGQAVTLLEMPDRDNLSFLYTEDRLARLRQQILFSKAVSTVMQKDGFFPDVLWLNECASAFLAPTIFSNPLFPIRPKVLYTNHTALGSARELYREYRWDEIGIPDSYKSVFIEQDTLDLMWGLMTLTDLVNGVSVEHVDVLQRLFPQWVHKIDCVSNGVHPAHWMHPKLREYIQAHGQPSGRELLDIHQTGRRELINAVHHASGKHFDEHRFIVGWNRRFQGYKNNHWSRLYLSAIVAPYGSRVKTELGELDGLGGQFVAAGMAPESDMAMLEETRRYKDACGREPYAAFIDMSSIPLMEFFARGLDLHLSMPELGWEAAGTSPDRCAQNGIPTVANWTGTIPEWMRHFEWLEGTGNGFVVAPHMTSPQEQYYQVRYYAMIYHQAVLEGNANALKALERLTKNVFEAGKGRDIAITLAGYKRLIGELCQSNSLC